MNGLKLIRTICNYSQAALAEKFAVTRQAVNMWENSKKSVPDSRKAQICSFSTAERLFGDVFEAWRSAKDRLPEYVVLYTYAIFASTDGISIAFGNISEEDFINSEDQKNEIYDTKELTVNISELIKCYLAHGERLIDEKRNKLRSDNRNEKNKEKDKVDYYIE